MMREVERLLDVKGTAEDARKQMISAIAAWAIDHPGQRVEAAQVFPQHLRRLKDAIFADKRIDVAKMARDIVILVRDEGAGLDLNRTRNARASLDALAKQFGYCDACGVDLASMLLRKRYNDLIVA
jgi:hypothetical protein